MTVKSNIRLLSMIFITGVLILSACSSSAVTQSPTLPPPTQPAPTATQAPSATIVPTKKPTPTSTAQPSPSPLATATSLPTITSTPPEHTLNPLKPGTTVQITQIKMFDAHHGWAVAQAGADLVDHILVTADGGSTWQDRTPLNAVGQPASGRFTADVYFGDLQDAWVMFGNSSAPAGDQPLTVWFTKDGGTTWTQSSPLDMSGIPAAFYVPSSLGFLDNQQFGWLLIHLGAGMMHDYIAGFITLDGGANWQIIINPLVNTPLMACPKTGFVFTSQTDGWLTGNCPGLMPTLVFFQSTDGGNVWNPITLPAASDMPAAFSPDQLGNNCGIPSLEITQPGNFMLDLTCINFDLNQASTWLYNSPDGGVTWNSLAASEPYGSFDFLNAQQGWQIGMQINDPSAPAEIFATHDGGSTWEHLINVNWHGDMDFIDAQNGWVVARNGDQIALVYSSDGGKSWQELQPSIGQPQP